MYDNFGAHVPVDEPENKIALPLVVEFNYGGDVDIRSNRVYFRDEIQYENFTKREKEAYLEAVIKRLHSYNFEQDIDNYINEISSTGIQTLKGKKIKGN